MRLQEKPDRVNIRFRRKKEENKKHEQSSTLKNSTPFTLTTIKTLKEKRWKIQRIVQPLCLTEKVRMMPISYHLIQ